MCKALEDIYNDGVQDGMEQGRRSGIAEGEAIPQKGSCLSNAKAWLFFGCNCSSTERIG